VRDETRGVVFAILACATQLSAQLYRCYSCSTYGARHAEALARSCRRALLSNQSICYHSRASHTLWSGHGRSASGLCQQATEPQSLAQQLTNAHSGGERDATLRPSRGNPWCWMVVPTCAIMCGEGKHAVDK
jgi:hypothetical protein